MRCCNSSFSFRCCYNGICRSLRYGKTGRDRLSELSSHGVLYEKRTQGAEEGQSREFVLLICAQVSGCAYVCSTRKRTGNFLRLRGNSTHGTQRWRERCRGLTRQLQPSAMACAECQRAMASTSKRNEFCVVLKTPYDWLFKVHRKTDLRPFCYFFGICDSQSFSFPK